jgi:hypothetical protein
MNPIPSITVAPTSERRPEPGRFGAALKAAATGLARGVAATVELAAPYVPGATVLSGAVRSAAAGAGLPGALRPDLGGAAQGGGSEEAELLEATRAMQQEARTFNLQYLQLQEGMQRESREFTALSNVLKVKHDSAKSAINNIH